MGGWQPGAPGSAPAPPGTVGMERTSPWAENSHGPDQGCLKPQPQWGADTRDPALGRGHILHGSACAAGSILGAARGQSAALDAHGAVAVAAGGAGSAPISPHWQKGGDGGVPASGYLGTAPSRHRRSSPAPLSRHSVGLRTRLPRTPGCGPLPKARSSLTPLRPSLLPSLSLRSSAPLRPSVRPSVCPFLSAGLGRSGWPGGGGTALPPAGIQLSLSLLYFPLLSPLVSGRCSDLDRDFWNNNDNTVQQKWSSYPPKEFILNISPYAPYGDPRLSLK